MSIFEALLIGIIQGISEFLPISSDGHLVLLPAIFGLTEPSLQAISIAHQGTLLAVLLYFYKDIWVIIQAVLKSILNHDLMESSESRMGWYILVGTIPAGTIGLLFKDSFEELFKNPQIAAYCLLGTAGMLIIGEYLRTGIKPLSEMSWLDAILIGVAQVVAILPGISRSGTTITTGLLRGFNREASTRFSFLLGIPAILGAGLLALIDLLGDSSAGSQLPALLVAFVTSGVVGYACIHFLLQWVKNRSLTPFALYCAGLAMLYLTVFAN